MCQGMDVEVKRFLRAQKIRFFMELCGILTPSMGSIKIRSRVRSLASKIGSRNSGVFAKHNSPILRKLQYDLVASHIVPVTIAPKPQFYETDPMNRPFLKQELDVALSACMSRSAPSLYGITHKVIRSFSDPISDFVLYLFNGIFLSFSFLEAWTHTLVMFILEPAEKGFHLISLTFTIGKLFKRLV